MPSSHTWTATEAAYQLSEAFAASRGEEGADPNYTTLQTLALAMAADADYLEEVWAAWCEEMEFEGWTEKQTTDARYWLEVVVIEELATA